MNFTDLYLNMHTKKMKHNPKSFEELNYYLKAGKLPSEKKAPHKGNWQLVYNTHILLYDEPYAACMKGLKEFGMRSMQYPNKTSFKILPV